MTLVLYNTLFRRKEVFIPRHPQKVGIYLCGPTVYDRAHLGNARPVIVFDVLVRLLERSFKVCYVRNITDIDDKIMLTAERQGVSISTITAQTIAYYHQDMTALGARPPTHEPQATQYVPQMIDHIIRLIEQKHAYEAEGHVLFDVASFSAYGRLSGCNHEEILAGARVEVAPYKKNAQDFVLWKPSKAAQPGWESPWGRGRPGWHIECSAMSAALLGDAFDIHGGGQDLIFPHHENEIAQSMSLGGENSFANLWMHNGILTVNGEKMSKSLGNFLTVEALLAEATGETIRLALLLAHYRQTLDWTAESLPRAKASLDRFYRALEGYDGNFDPQEVDERVLEALEDDLNTPLAIARLHEIAQSIYQTDDLSLKKAWQTKLKASGFILGLLQQATTDWFQKGVSSIDEAVVKDLIAARQRARDQRDFKEADHIRQKLLDYGILLEDTPHGTIWRKD